VNTERKNFIVFLADDVIEQCLQMGIVDMERSSPTESAIKSGNLSGEEVSYLTLLIREARLRDRMRLHSAT